MEIMHQWLIRKYKSDNRIMSVVTVGNPNKLPTKTDGFDLLVLIVTSDIENNSNNLFHYIKDGMRIQERRVHTSTIEQWFMPNQQESILEWVLEGNIIIDHNHFLESLRHRIFEFQIGIREQKLLIEFSKFLRKYLHSKECLMNDFVLDAYNSVLDALHQWARIVLIEEGCHPEQKIWHQVKSINPGVYKLYEELTMNRESIKQRVELVLLACEFSVISKMERCCKGLIKIMSNKQNAWSIVELKDVPELQLIQNEIPLLLNKLVYKHLIEEKIEENHQEGRSEIKYSVAN
jgi:hypothetical protein